MTRRLAPTAVATAALMIAATGASAQTLRLTNGTLTQRAAASPLPSSFRSLIAAQPDASWIGYAVPVVDSERVMCCSDSSSGTSFVNGSFSGRSCCTGCRLEASAGTAAPRNGQVIQPAGPIKLEAATSMVVMFRVADHKVERIRVFSEECEVDAGGRPVTWLDGVRPSESVSLLETLAASDVERSNGSLIDGAISAIALHADASADGALDRLVSASQPEPVRRKVTFWLGNARGAHGLATLRRVLHDDPAIEVRKSAVFGVSQSHEPAAFDTLAGLARADGEVRIRSEAVFWIAQRGDTRASAVIMEALEKDPSTEVRKKAVFALGQLKDDAGIDALLNVARTGSDAAVRGEAIFWLGQKAGRKAAQAITDRIDNDPNTEVKKRAVFALSQMPAAEGVPLLIDVARKNSNAEVRKQAMFWLGQSKDPKAVSFFEEVLLK